MAEGAPEPGKAVESPFTLADACTDLIAANVRSNLRGLGHPDRDLFMHAEVAEALVERISARGDMDDEALAHFTAAHTRYRGDEKSFMPHVRLIPSCQKYCSRFA